MNSCAVLAQAIMEIIGKGGCRQTPALYKKLHLYELEIEDVPQLTKWHFEIIQAIADDPRLTLVQVADRLGIAESTLRNNLSAVSRALDTPSLNRAMIECLRIVLINVGN
jgi:DNA-binding NarL/FixJ family response regulator